MSASGVCSEEALASLPEAAQGSWQLTAIFVVVLVCIVALGAVIYDHKLQSLKTSPKKSEAATVGQATTTSPTNKALENPKPDACEAVMSDFVPDFLDPKTLKNVQKEFRRHRSGVVEGKQRLDRPGKDVACLPAPGALEPATLKTIQNQHRNSRGKKKTSNPKASEQLKESVHSDAQDANGALQDWPCALQHAQRFVTKTVEDQKLWIKDPSKRLFMGDWALWRSGSPVTGTSGRADSDVANSITSTDPRTNRKTKKKRKANAKLVPVLLLCEVVPSLHLVLTPSRERKMAKAADLQLFQLPQLDSNFAVRDKSNAYLLPLMAYVQKHHGNLRKLWRESKLVDAVFSAIQALHAVPESAQTKLLAACMPSLKTVAKMVATANRMANLPVDKVLFEHDTRISKALEHLSCQDKARLLCTVVRLAAHKMGHGCIQLGEDDLAVVSFSGLEMLGDNKLLLELSAFNPYTCDTGFFDRQVQFAHVLDRFDLIEHGSGTGLGLAAALAVGKAQSIFGVDLLHPRYTTAPIVRNVVRSLAGVEFKLVTTPEEGNQAVVEQLDFVVGCVVRISGLNNAKHYNGRYGRVTNTETAHGRLRVIVRAAVPKQV